MGVLFFSKARLMKKIGNKERKEIYIETFNTQWISVDFENKSFSITCRNLCLSQFCPKYDCANFVVSDLFFFHLQ